MNILEKKFKVARISDIDEAIAKRRKITDQEFEAQQEKNQDHAEDQAIGEWMSERRGEINILGRR